MNKIAIKYKGIDSFDLRHSHIKLCKYIFSSLIAIFDHIGHDQKTIFDIKTCIFIHMFKSLKGSCSKFSKFHSRFGNFERRKNIYLKKNIKDEGKGERWWKDRAPRIVPRDPERKKLVSTIILAISSNTLGIILKDFFCSL